MLEEDNKISFEEMDYACAFGKVDIVKEFIDKGFDVNTLYLEYPPLLYIACEYEQEEVVKILIEAEANLNLGNPLNIALFYENESIAIILINAGADINTSFSFVRGEYETIYNFTPLMSAAESDMSTIYRTV